MSWINIISWRYFNSKKKDKFVNLATTISIATSALAIAFLIICFSIFRGYNEVLVEKLTKNSGHIVITNSEPFEPKEFNDKLKIKHESICEATALLASGSHSTPVYIQASSNYHLKNIDSKNVPIVVSKSLADLMHYKPTDIVSLIIPTIAAAPFFILPENVTCEIVKIERFESDEMNEYCVSMNLNDLQQILSLGSKINKIKCFSNSFHNIDSDFKSIKKQFPSHNIFHWKELNEFFLKMMKSEQNIFMILLIALMILASLIYILAIGMFINSKKKDIRIFKILGANHSNIHKIFLSYSMILASFNIIAGTCLGVFISFNVNNIVRVFEKIFKITLFANDIYLINYIPVKINIFDILFILIITFLISMISSFWISKKMNSLDVFKNL